MANFLPTVPNLKTSAIVCALAAIGCGRASRSPCPSVLNLTPALCSAMIQTVLPDGLPPSGGNRFAESYDAARFGHRVFFDARFSKNISMRCADCHVPERAFQDGTATPAAAPAVTRNTPTSINSAWLKWQFWDGRADSLWSQALLPFENPNEMKFTRLEAVHLVDTAYRASYELAFGPLPDFSNTSRFPARGAPGDPLFDGMAAADKDAVNLVFVNVGKAIEAYERKLAAGRSPVDRYLLGDSSALNEREQRGLAVFARASCTACHSGPMFTDELFHNLGVPAQPGVTQDRGRADAFATLLASPFTRYGSFSDSPPPADDPAYRPDGRELGAIRTPSLRNLSLSAPYGHNGAFASLEDVVDFHLRGGGRGQSGYPGEVDALLQPQTLTADDRDALIAFLKALKGEYPQTPWAGWPS